MEDSLWIYLFLIGAFFWVFIESMFFCEDILNPTDKENTHTSSDERIKEKLYAMKMATGEDKIEAIVALLEELARRSMAHGA